MFLPIARQYFTNALGSRQPDRRILLPEDPDRLGRETPEGGIFNGEGLFGQRGGLLW